MIQRLFAGGWAFFATGPGHDGPSPASAQLAFNCTGIQLRRNGDRRRCLLRQERLDGVFHPEGWPRGAQG